ncbi:MAG: bifunctional 5,10-methylene-tetrahydrofolate dehydrogenase/5,10-methylene-tetrahydrofolate cyclohydrolase [Bacteroidales bacterium]|jgi:methylenetetrahydrofolate dehydrogenase (NADP+)/methenyltetrahydrofolate cyclohydrolase|nr:bifunctional 5,10-methylene-tetrahydrofolate dehydrogenase/5,10-methylene-tetrahydrofolate cyclohydrolase [Bacteroidales bacterium]
MQIIDGKAIALEIKMELAQEVKQLLEHGQAVPHLAAVIVGSDGASLTYMESIKRNCKEVGYIASVYQFPANVQEAELLAALDFLNQDDEIDGYIIQLPLPKHISLEKVVEHVDYNKDMDCFHPFNTGKLMLGQDAFFPATPYGTIELIKRAGIEIAGKHCVMVGRSNIVGKPLAMLLARNHPDANATVTVCHSKTANLQEICRQADILLVAIGKPEMITADYVKQGATVIDIGIHRIEDPDSEKGYRICGDVKYDEVAKKCAAITPVPGGVGPMTMSCLLLNVMKACKSTRN